MRFPLAFACLTLACAAAAGCGSSSDETTGGTIDSGSSSIDSSADETAAADTGSATDSSVTDSSTDSPSDTGTTDSETADSSNSDGGPDATGASCGGFAGKPCPTGYFCKSAPGMCKVADGGGTCVAIPATCASGDPKVCGCDGTTYTDCSAIKAGVNVDHVGACATSGKSCGGKTGATCNKTEFCDYPDGAMCGAFDATGTCTPRPDICPGVVTPVCGCDGTTHNNACEAHRAGFDDSHAGACP
jgi:hypothetical protein